jgi:hypothetical protein
VNIIVMFSTDFVLSIWLFCHHLSKQELNWIIITLLRFNSASRS